jgi:hypothetical protein
VAVVGAGVGEESAGAVAEGEAGEASALGTMELPAALSEPTVAEASVLCANADVSGDKVNDAIKAPTKIFFIQPRSDLLSWWVERCFMGKTDVLLTYVYRSMSILSQPCRSG